MPETRRTKHTSTQEALDEAQADALAQAWALSRPPQDLWAGIEQSLEPKQPESPDVATAQERAKREGIPFVDLAKHRPEPSALACVSADLAYHYRAIPVRKDANRLFVAMENPRDIHAVDALRLHSKLMVQPMLAAVSQIAAAIKECYPRTDAAGGRGTVPPKPPVSVGSNMPWGESLPPELAGVLSLWQNGKTITEIAKELELTEATVKVRIHRARLRIRKAEERSATELETAYSSFDAFLKEWDGQKETNGLSHLLEKWLAQCVERGGNEGVQAREVLINANLYLVTSIARKYQNRGIAIEDLMPAGAEALSDALDKYDWRRGFRFATYATHWIRQALGRVVESGEKATVAEAPQSPASSSAPLEDAMREMLTELKALREEVGALRREVAQLRRSERKSEFGAALLPYLPADDRGLPLG